MKYKKIKNYYEQLNKILKNNYKIFSEETPLNTKDKYSNYLEALVIEKKTIKKIYEQLNLKISSRLKIEEYDYNVKYKNGEFIFIVKNNENIGYIECISMHGICYICNVHVLEEKRGLTAIQILQSLIIYFEKNKIVEIIVVCQEINKNVQKIYKKLGFNFISNLGKYDEIWLNSSDVFKKNSKKYLNLNSEKWC